MDIWSVLIAGVVGIAIATLFFTVGLKFLKRFFKNAKLIRNYWIFVTVFVTLSTGVYIAIFLIPGVEKNITISVVNHATALVFAIFTGYFAFSQVMESRFEKLNADALNQLKNQDYTDAAKTWELALAIKRKDHSTLGNLLEVYIIQGQYAKVEDQLDLLTKILPPEKKEVAHILSAMMNLMRGHNGEAGESIAEAAQIIKAKEKRTYYPRWDFKDIKDSPKYQSMKGESKKIFDNFSLYVQGGLSEEHKNKFEDGDHILAA